VFRTTTLKIEDLPIPESVKHVIVSSQISSLYPPQEDAINAGALDGANLVLASPTASGKTLVAELCAMKHVLEGGGKVLYLTPLRALTSEKFDDFQKYTSIPKKNGQRITVALSTGDYDGSDPWLGRYDIIIATNEKCDSLLRHRPEWIQDVTLVVADEVHTLIDRDRGPTLEVTLTRLRETNPHAQLLALSATISNADEIADWLDAKSITTDWRPVTLREGVYLDGECQFNDGDAVRIREADANPAVNLSLHTIRQGGQTLIFANTRRRAVAHAKRAGNAVHKLLSTPEKRALKHLAERLVRAGERTRLSTLLADLVEKGVAFHHAGLAAAHRKLIEDAFRGGRIKIVAATPTLAAGVNLPARTVIISNTRRYDPGFGLYDISVLDYKQMAGRAGRPKYDETGDAILIAGTADEQDYLMERYVFSTPERIWSKLAVEKTLRSHVLASIAAGFTHTTEGVMAFFRKTFYAQQFDADLIDELVSKVLTYLYAEEMVTVEGRRLEATRFGRRVSELYIDPVSGVIIRDGLETPPPQITDIGLLHLICHTPDVSPKYYPRRREIEGLHSFSELHADEFFFPTPSDIDFVGYETFLGEVKGACVVDSWIHEISEEGIIEKFSVEPGDLYRLISSVSWLLYAARDLARLFRYKSLPRRVFELQQRVEKGVKEELLPVVALEGVGRVRGRILFNAGFRTLDDLKQASFTQLTELPLIGPQIAKRIKEQVGGLIKSEEVADFKSTEEWQQKALSDFEPS
jgi:helicase